MQGIISTFVVSAFVLGYAAVQAQTIASTTGTAMQSAQDPRAPVVFSQCRNPPASGVALRGGTGEPDPGPREYMISGIGNVVSPGERWSVILSDIGNNADGLVGLDDGSLLIAQNSRGGIVKVEADGELMYPYPDTRTGGALSLSTTGALFVAEWGSTLQFCKFTRSVPSWRTLLQVNHSIVWEGFLMI